MSTQLHCDNRGCTNTKALGLAGAYPYWFMVKYIVNDDEWGFHYCSRMCLILDQQAKLLREETQAHQAASPPEP